MINSLSIKNFRCFKAVDLRDFGRFNIIVGGSGSGKTSLLEAIFLPGNGAGVPVTLRNQRGMVVPSFSPVKQVYDSMFSDLFYGFDTDVPVEITLAGSYENSRKVKIYFNPISEKPLVPELKGDSFTDKLFTFRTIDADNKESIQQVNLQGNITSGGQHKEASITLLAASIITNSIITAQLLSELSKVNADAEIQQAMTSIYHEISNLKVELTSGIPEIHCNYVGISRKVPLSLVSNGMTKVLCILLFIASQKNGVVMVDEIENGIYYKTLPKMWELIIEFCNKFNVQFFASTHSKECLEKLNPLIEKRQNDFRLIRTEADEYGIHSARIFKGENLAASLEIGSEIR
jgi:AAA15 family ATPase/GTPase